MLLPDRGRSHSPRAAVCGRVDQRVGDLAHGRGDDDDPVPLIDGGADQRRRLGNTLRGPDGGPAELHDNQHQLEIVPAAGRRSGIPSSLRMGMSRHDSSPASRSSSDDADHARRRGESGLHAGWLGEKNMQAGRGGATTEAVSKATVGHPNPRFSDQRRGQTRRTHQEFVDRPRRAAALGDRPDDQRLAALHVAGGEHAAARSSSSGRRARRCRDRCRPRRGRRAAGSSRGR